MPWSHQSFWMTGDKANIPAPSVPEFPASGLKRHASPTGPLSCS